MDREINRQNAAFRMQAEVFLSLLFNFILPKYVPLLGHGSLGGLQKTQRKRCCCASKSLQIIADEADK